MDDQTINEPLERDEDAEAGESPTAERVVIGPEPGKRRVAMRVAYDGADFYGWQTQSNDGNELRSIQGTLEQALAQVTGEPIRLFAAGRTDAGVHAQGQCVHFDLAARIPAAALPLALAQKLPQDIAVWEARDVPPLFHSRHSATRRAYKYLMVMADKRVPPAVMARRHAGYFRGLHDLDALRRAAGMFVGHHDFTHFRSTDCQQKSAMRTIDSMSATILGDDARRTLGLYPGQAAIEIRVASRSFLMHQVRCMVGTLARISRGKMPIEDLRGLLRGERSPSAKGGLPMAPPQGLTLWDVEYGENAPI